MRPGAAKTEAANPKSAGRLRSQRKASNTGVATNGYTELPRARARASNAVSANYQSTDCLKSAGVRVTAWVREPLFLVDAPAVRCDKWTKAANYAAVAAAAWRERAGATP